MIVPSGKLPRWLRSGRIRSAALAYVLATCVTGLCVLAALHAAHVFMPVSAMLFGLATVLAGLWGGTGPGLWAALLGAAAFDYFVFPPYGDWGLSSGTLIVAACFTGLSLAAAALGTLLRRRSGRLRSVLVASPVGMVARDLAGRITSWNGAAERMFGWREKELLGKECPLAPPPLTGEYREMQMQALATGQPQRDRAVRARRKDGTLLEVLVTEAPILGAAGQAVGTLSIFVDRTEQARREEAEASLRASEGRLQQVLRAADLGTWHWLPGTDVLHWSPRCRELFGVAPDEPLSFARFLDALHPDDRARIDGMVREAMRRSSEYRAEMRVLLPGGKVRWVVAQGSFTRGADGQPAEMQGVVWDDTERLELLARLERERQRAEEGLRRAEAARARLGALLEVVDASLSSLDRDELLRSLLDRLRTLLGTDVATLLLVDEERGGLVVEATSGAEQAVAPQVFVPLGQGFSGRIAATGEPWVVEDIRKVQTASPWLREHLCSVLGVPLRLDGKVLGVLHVGTMRPRRFTPDEVALLRVAADRCASAIQRATLFARERQARLEAQAATEEATRASEAKDQFLAQVSHELRNPLAAMLTGVELLQQRTEDERSRRTLEIVHRNVQAQARLINDLLDLSRLRTGKLRIQRAPICLATLAREVAQEQRPVAVRAGLGLIVDAPEPVWVHGDRDRLRQVLLNLLSNAFKFTPEGEVRIRVRRERQNASLIVEDTGVGIEPGQLERIFEIFRQGDLTPAPGMGLGLTLVRSLVELHGGSARAESEGRGKGSRFQVVLPAIEAPAVRASANANPGETGGARVLVVEDNPDMLLVLSESLEGRGYEVERAGSGEEALEKLANWRPDVILADLGLPDMDGVELLRKVRQQERLAHVPAFAVTGWGQDSDLRRTKEAGFEGHFVKPVDLDSLDASIRELLAA